MAPEHDLPGWRFPMRWDLFWLKYRALLGAGQPPMQIAREAGLRILLFALNQTGWALDELINPSWRELQLRGPLFILGHQRSGTTLLHRQLCANLPGAYGMRFLDMFLPSTTWQRLQRIARRLDARHNESRLARSLQILQEQRLGALDPIHRLRLTAIEEDEFALWSIFASAMCANDTPLSSSLTSLARLRQPEHWPRHEQIADIEYYRACLLKTAASQPPTDLRPPTDPRSLAGSCSPDSSRSPADSRSPKEPPHKAPRSPLPISKNPAFSKRIPLLAERFPQARFLYLLRDPRRTIPSRLSLIQAIWQLRFGSSVRLNAEQIEAIVDDSCRIYLQAQRALDHLPQERWRLLRFDELVRSSASAIRRICEELELGDPVDGLEESLAQARERRATQTQHHYALADFGLDEIELRQRLEPIFARHDFP